MPISIIWDNDQKTIIKHIYDGQWSLDEFHQAVDQNAEMIRSVPHPVDIIVDLRKSMVTAPKMLSAVGNVERKTPDNQRMTVIIGADRFTSMLLNIASRMAPRATQNLKLVSTMDEAYHLLNQLASK